MRVSVMLFLLVVTGVQAEVYKSVNADGEVVYSDRPSPGGERVRMPALPTYTPQPVRTLSRSTRTMAEEETRYETFTLGSPADQATIRNNLGTIAIETRLTPALMTSLGHRIRFYLDGQPVGEPTEDASLVMNNVDRGEHRLSASVLDAQGAVLISAAPVTVYVKRNSKLHGTREGTFTDNPGYITDNPNLTDDGGFQPYSRKDIADFSGNSADSDPDLADQPANPGFRNRNPNILSPNPNIRTHNPYLVNPPLPRDD